MTNEEAINDLKEISDDYLLNHFITPNNRESLRTAISTIEKQIPKKQIEIKERHNFRGDVIYKDGFCSICKKEISSAYLFCNNCGQEIIRQIGNQKHTCRRKKK